MYNVRMKMYILKTCKNYPDIIAAIQYFKQSTKNVPIGYTFYSVFIQCTFCSLFMYTWYSQHDSLCNLNI